MSVPETKDVKPADAEVQPGDDHKEPVFSLDDDAAGEIIELVSADQVKFKVTRKNALISKLMSQAIEGDPRATEIDVPGAKAKSLKLVIEYMEHHVGVPEAIIEKPLKSKVMKDNCKDPWDATYIDRIGETKQDVYDLMLAANYMDIKCLLHLTCAKVGSWIKGQPLEKLREILAVKKDDVKTAPTPVAAITDNSASSSSSSSSCSSSANSSSSSTSSSSSAASSSPAKVDADVAVPMDSQVTALADTLAASSISATPAGSQDPLTIHATEAS